MLYRSIITTRGFYQWNSRLRDCEVDVYEFERLAYEARDYPAGSEERMPFYERMIELYTGPLQLSVVQSWVVPIATYFQNLYADCVYGMIEILKARGEHEKIAALCERAEGAGVSEERLQMEHMLALSISSSAKGRGTMKRKDAQRTYDSARKAEQQAKLAMDALLKQVKSSKDGAYLCEYPTFLELCGVERQLSERMSTVQVLCLMALHAGDISDEELQVQTQRLCELACGCLQGGRRRLLQRAGPGCGAVHHRGYDHWPPGRRADSQLLRRRQKRAGRQPPCLPATAAARLSKTTRPRGADNEQPPGGRSPPGGFCFPTGEGREAPDAKLRGAGVRVRAYGAKKFF